MNNSTSIRTSAFLCFALKSVWNASRPHSQLPPESEAANMSLLQAMHSLLNKGQFRLAVVVGALVYVSRIRKHLDLEQQQHTLYNNSALVQISHWSLFEIFSLCLCLSQKHNNDFFYHIKWWSKVTGIANWNSREWTVLDGLNGRLLVPHSLYQDWQVALRGLARQYDQLQARVMAQKSNTYTFTTSPSCSATSQTRDYMSVPLLQPCPPISQSYVPIPPVMNTQSMHY
ncbi:hypothetical protein HDU91_007071 [Kappamyces sp. JEL0680]|nr:hypothetical protein HDU91_007071 [Kappamyces sp. JEL0680]